MTCCVRYTILPSCASVLSHHSHLNLNFKSAFRCKSKLFVSNVLYRLKSQSEQDAVGCYTHFYHSLLIVEHVYLSYNIRRTLSSFRNLFKVLLHVRCALSRLNFYRAPREDKLPRRGITVPFAHKHFIQSVGADILFKCFQLIF